MQNENVNRAHTSEHRVHIKVLVKKTFAFVELLWSAYVDENKPDVSIV